MSETKKELREKNNVIRLYEMKLEAVKDSHPPPDKVGDRFTDRNHPYNTEGILDRIQSLKQLTRGKIRHKDRRIEINEVS